MSAEKSEKVKKFTMKIFKSVFQIFKYGDASKVIFKMCELKVITFLPLLYILSTVNKMFFTTHRIVNIKSSFLKLGI
jgi:hypothetical protein